ncbi:MAG: hypothetical protein ACXVCA_19770, partial [Bdellovibrio sp.]
MKKIILIHTLLSLLFANTALAQLRRGSPGSLENLKKSRKELELNTENQILEKLEQARLEDEK